MARLCGACCGLLVFSAMIVCGLGVGNPAKDILLRALVGLFGGFVLGSLVGWIGMMIVSDNLGPQDESEGVPAEDGESTMTQGEPAA